MQHIFFPFFCCWKPSLVPSFNHCNSCCRKTGMGRYLCCVGLDPWGAYPGVLLLGHMEKCVTFLKGCLLISIWMDPFKFSMQVYKGYHLCTCQPAHGHSLMGEIESNRAFLPFFWWLLNLNIFQVNLPFEFHPLSIIYLFVSSSQLLIFFFLLYFGFLSSLYLPNVNGSDV